MATTSRVDDIFSGVFMMAGFALCITGIGVGAMQAYWFLQDGVWTSISVIDAVKHFKPYDTNSLWLYSPTEWIGVWKILNAFPCGAAVFLFGFFVFLGAAADR